MAGFVFFGGLTEDDDRYKNKNTKSYMVLSKKGCFD